MKYQVARLQEIYNAVQHYCKLNWKNYANVSVMLDAEGLASDDINLLISAGIKAVGFQDIYDYLEAENRLLPVKKVFLGEMNDENLEKVLANFDVLESVCDMAMVEKISNLNARTGRVSEMYFRLNVLSDIKKFGFLPGEIVDEALETAKFSGIRLFGINSYIPLTMSEKRKQTALSKIKAIYGIFKERFKYVDNLSLNYQGNFVDLIEIGCNEIRIGLKDLED